MRQQTAQHLTSVLILKARVIENSLKDLMFLSSQSITLKKAASSVVMLVTLTMEAIRALILMSALPKYQRVIAMPSVLTYLPASHVNASRVSMEMVSKYV